MSSKREHKKRRVFNTYNLIILLSIAVILGAGYILLEKQGVDVASYLPINEIKDMFSSKEVEVASEEEKLAEGQKASTQGLTVSANTPDVKNTDTGINARNIDTNMDQTTTTSNNSNTDITTVAGEISEQEAKAIALQKFQTLGETDTNIDELEAFKIKRKEDMYYYISSNNGNTIEIKIADGTIARLNGVSQ